MKKILIVLLAFIIPSVTFATLKFVQTPTITLYSSVSGAATSLRVVPYPRDLDGTKLTFSSFGSSPTFTIDPKVRNYEEIIGFTGITDNGDNTATFTGLTRDLISQYPYTTIGTGRAHTAGAIVVFSNNPQMYNRFAVWENTGTTTAVWKFGSTTPPRYDYVGVQSSGTYIATTSEFASVAYVNAVTTAGAPNGTVSVKGVYQSATGLQAASSTLLGSTAASLALTSAIATDTPSVPQSVSASSVIISNLAGYIKQAWLNLTENFVTSGAWTFAASVAKPLTLNTLSYVFPSSQSAGTMLTNDGSGNLSWGSGWTLLTSTTTTAAMKVATTTFTGTAQDLRVIISNPNNLSGATFYQLQFNTDLSTNNYGYAVTSFAGSLGNDSGSASQFINLTPVTSATTSPAFFEIRIKNILANAKDVQWSGSLRSSATVAPSVITGAAVWSNTSAVITSVTFSIGGANTIPIGAIIRVYGSN